MSLLDRQSYYNPQSASPCGNEAGNNGNIYSIVDNLQVGLTQSFSYDSLNRVRSGSRSDGAYNHTYNYDSFGNMIIKDNLALGSAVEYDIDSATSRLLRSHDGGATWGDYVYDATGTMMQSSDGISQAHTYQHNAMGQLLSIDGGAASYVYNESDQRAFKQTASGTIEYVYFKGQPVAERDQSGNWTDYIYANGQKIARLGLDERVHREGQVCSSCGWQWAALYTAVSMHGHVVQAGDKLAVTQYQAPGTRAGVGLNFTDGSISEALPLYDQDGNLVTSDSVSGQWHSRVIDLSSQAGKTVDFAYFLTDGGTAPGAWSVDYRDFIYLGADGTVTKLYSGEDPSGFTVASSSGQSNMVNASEPNPPYPGNVGPIRYYIDDHLGSTQMELSSGGWPVWSGQFTPFGQEIVGGQVHSANLGNPQPGDGTNMHYKFTGKERDSESGLDYFGARYYASSVGRFLSPDWSTKPVAVPYSRLEDPQSLNLYSYVNNKPLSKVDVNGHMSCGGENHSFLWCVGHALGLKETQKEKSERIEAERQMLLSGQHADGSPLTSAERTRLIGASQTQIDQYFQLVAENSVLSPYLPVQASAEQSTEGLYRDAAGKIHNPLPDRVPDNWSRAQLEEARDELRASIQKRIEESKDFGGPDSGHMARIRQEQQLLRQIEDKLGNK